tara:strand:+ start:3351 stop:3482 length:132 start_codon:yes stop_codon:yes gene_type:complete
MYKTDIKKEYLQNEDNKKIEDLKVQLKELKIEKEVPRKCNVFF